MHPYWPNQVITDFTLTPNLFFDDIMLGNQATWEQAKLVAYVIRNTIGYNRGKGKTYVKADRSTIVREAGISYGKITGVIEACKEHGWLIDFLDGPIGRQQRYLFLCTPHNICLVKGLTMGVFKVDDIKHLNSDGIDALVAQYQLDTPTCNERVPVHAVNGRGSRYERGQTSIDRSGQEEPESRHLYKNIKDYKENNNKTEDVVADVLGIKLIQAHAAASLNNYQPRANIIKRWLSMTAEGQPVTVEYVIRKIDFIAKKMRNGEVIKNLGASLHAAIRDDWDTDDKITSEQTTGVPSKGLTPHEQARKLKRQARTMEGVL